MSSRYIGRIKKITISPGRIADFKVEGHEWFKAELDLYFWEIAGKYKVKIEMVDFAGNELNPSYEKEVEGWFGGVLRFLEELGAFLSAIISAIADAVMKALSFLADLLMAIIQPIIDGITRGLEDLLRPWGRDILRTMERALASYKESGTVPDYVVRDIDQATFQSLIPNTITIIIQIIAFVALPFLTMIGGLVGMIIGLILSIFFNTIFPAIGEFAEKILNLNALLDATLDFLGVTHETPWWFSLIMTIVGGFVSLGELVKGLIKGAKIGFWLSVAGLGLAATMSLASFAAKIGYEYERSYARSEERREMLDEVHKSVLFWILVGKFAAYMISSIGLVLSIGKSGAGWILSMISWTLAMIGFVAGAVDLHWWGGAHVG